MKKYQIEVQEFLARVVEIEAENINDAISKVNEQYEKTEIVLYYNDFVEVNFLDVNSQSPNDEKDTLIKGIVEYMYEEERRHFEEFDSKPENHIYLKIK